MKNYRAHICENTIFKTAPIAMRYDGKEPFSEWQKKARAKLSELLGLPFERCDYDFEIEYIKEEDGYTEYRFSVQTEPNYYVPCHLLVPKNSKKQVPLTLCLSGHCNGMHIALGVAKSEKDEKSLASWPHRAMAPRSIKEGRAALVIEARNLGESSLEGYGATCTDTARVALLLGRTVIGERVWDAMRVLDTVEKNFPMIDMSDIVCTGNSGGGTATYYLACLDERISAAAPSCAICTYEHSIAAMHHCICNFIPKIRLFFEMGDLAGMIAPRRLVIAAGKEDEIFPIDGTLISYQEIERLYTAAGARKNCALVIGDGGHLNYADLIWQKLHEMGV